MRQHGLVKHLSTLMICLACTSTAFAGSIGVRVDGVEQLPVASGNPISIDVDGRDSEVEIQIYDIADTDVEVYDDVGPIILSGTVSARVRVLIAPAAVSFADAFELPSNPITRDVRHFAGLFLTGSDGGASLRANTQVSINVLGDITGPIEASQVFRVYAGGTIQDTASINSYAADTVLGFQFADLTPAIAYVQADNGIRGDITVCDVGGWHRLHEMI